MDRVIFLGCALLLVLGLLIGMGLSSSIGLSNSIRTAFELLSFAGTAATAVVAVVALNSWQTQFRHSEKWKAIKKLQDALDCGRAATDYVNSLFGVIARNYRGDWNGRSVDFMKDYQAEQKAWLAQCYLVDKAWQELSLLLDDKEAKVFSVNHKAVEKDVEAVATYIISEYLKGEHINLPDVYEATQRCAMRARETASLMSSQSGDLQKSLVK